MSADLDCPTCHGSGWYYRDDPDDGTHYDCSCLGPSDSAKAKWLHKNLKCLASNIVWAAMLGKSFYLGFNEGFSASGEGFNGEYCPRLTPEKFAKLATQSQDQYDWRPGCQKESP